jgi:hypothetical protein
MKRVQRTARAAFIAWAVRAMYERDFPPRECPENVRQVNPEYVQIARRRWSQRNEMVCVWWAECTYHERAKLTRVPRWVRELSGPLRDLIVF